ncbi:MAG: hypothetical protein HZB25_00700 [Candidatus Eisenbacteria bacterium]|nr:hypothetical protein [Candidatus Eisenbacteria bacterium]
MSRLSLFRAARIALAALLPLLSLSCGGSTAGPPANPACAVDPASLDFGTVTIGQTADRTFTLTNNGAAPIAGTVTPGCTAFTVLGEATYSLAHGQSRTFTVRFSPPAPGGPAFDTAWRRLRGAPGGRPGLGGRPAGGAAASEQTCELVMGACGSVSARGTGVPATALPAWTVMVYMAADNNLALAGLRSLERMEAAGFDPQVHLVVQAEFNPAAIQQAGGNPASFHRPNYNTFRYFFDGTGENVPGPNGAATDIGNVNMTDPATLRDFVTWTRQHHPARHHALMVWNHGGGYTGLLADETSAPGHLMSLADLRAALTGTGALDLLGFDMSLMAGYETLSSVQGLTSFAVFSEEVVPGEGFPYDRILTALHHNPAADARAFTAIVADEFHASFTGNRAPTTISAFDLGAYAAFETALDSLATGLRANLGGLSGDIAAATAHSQKYTIPGLTDLVNFADSLRTRLLDPEMRDRIDAVKLQANGGFRVREHHRNGSSPSGADVSRSNGLHVLLPGRVGADDVPDAGPGSFASYQALYGGKAWTRFLASYLGSDGGSSTVDQGENRFECYLVWDTASVSHGADVDMWVLQPNGSLYIPFLGSVTPNGVLSGDSHAVGGFYEGFLTNRFLQPGVYKFYANLWLDPADYRPRFNFAYRANAASGLTELYTDPPRLSTQLSWLADPLVSWDTIEAGAYTDLQYVAYVTVAAPSGPRVRAVPRGGAVAGLGRAARDLRPTAAQLATLRRELGRGRPRGAAGVAGGTESPGHGLEIIRRLSAGPATVLPWGHPPTRPQHPPAPGR